MTFCWFTSFIGYPNFFRSTGRGTDLAEVFLKLGEAAKAGMAYSEAKNLFPDIDSHQVETKKAAFQEFGLLYVIPRSDTITLTPLGHQILDFCSSREIVEANRRNILLALTYGLARYQFNNPLPVGGNRREARERSTSSDVLPYLACYYLLHKLKGILTAGEIKGAIFGLQKMADLRALEDAIRNKRTSGQPFEDLAHLPTHRRTADNLKIYFVSHLSLDNEIMVLSKHDELYGGRDQAFELSEIGFEITESVLATEWKGWHNKSSLVTVANLYNNIGEYFANGVGKLCSKQIVKRDIKIARLLTPNFLKGILDDEDLDVIKELPRREYREGVLRLIQHNRLDRVRNPVLVRDAKKDFKIKYGKLFCEVCKFDFEIGYGDRGKDYIEAHHKTHISQLNESVILRIEDLAMVCSNCHRMLHRFPWMTVEELISIIDKNKI